VPLVSNIGVPTRGLVLIFKIPIEIVSQYLNVVIIILIIALNVSKQVGFGVQMMAYACLILQKIMDVIQIAPTITLR
jgi:hypothetical protein